MYLIKDFLNSKDIYFSKEKQKKIHYNQVHQRDIINHLKLLANFHKRVSENKEIILLNTSSEIGKQYESYKVSLKKFKKNYLKIKELEEKNIFLETVIKHGEKVIEYGTQAISKINYEDYISLIKRSMKNNEICLGNPFLENIYGHEKIYINDIENLSFNLVESDIINFINRLIKKRVIMNLDYIIEFYLNEMNLNEKSKEYIISMTKFPIEVIKIFDRKMYNKKEWSDEEASKKFVLAIKKIII